MRTLYDILGVSQQATYREIRDAYHCKVNAQHAATYDHIGGDEATAAAGDLRWIERAWDILSSPTCRRRYDQQLVAMFIRAAGELAANVSPGVLLEVKGIPGFSCRNCGEEAQAARTKCPRCGAPAKAVWVPKSRFLRKWGLAPALTRVANFLAHQYRKVTETLALLRTVLCPVAGPLLLVGLVLVLVVAYLIWLGSQSQEGGVDSWPTP